MQRPMIEYDKTFFKPGDTHILYDNIDEKEECNLYLVSTPGQLLSAIEAQHHFKTKNNVLVILFFVVGDGENINHMFKLSQYFPYDRLITYQNANQRNYKAFSNYLNILNRSIYNYIFVGYDSIAYRRMIVNVNHKELCFIDSGAHIIKVHKHYFSPNPQDKNYEVKTFKQLSSKGKLVYFQYKMYGYKRDGYTQKPIFFTVYNLMPYNNEKIIRHKYEYLKELFKLDMDIYKSNFLTIYNNSVAGHKEILIQRKIRSLGLEDESIVSSTGVSLDLYPNILSSVSGYETRLQSMVIDKEKQLFTIKLKTNNDFLKQLQHAFVIKEEVIFTDTLNRIMCIFLKNLHSREENNKVDSSIKRIVVIMDILIESFKLLCAERNEFNPAIDEEIFYLLFEHLTLYTYTQTIKSKEKILLLKRISELYAYFFGALKDNKSIRKAEKYYKKNIHIFKTQKTTTLVQMLKVQKSSTSHLYIMANKLATNMVEKKQYMTSHLSFYALLSLLDVLNNDIEVLTKYFIEKNFKILNIKLHLEALKIMIKAPSYRKIIRNRAFEIFNRGSYKREDRISAGLVAAESYMYQGNKAQATKYFLLVWNRFGCTNRTEALSYLETMNTIGLLNTQQEKYEKLYTQYVFGPFSNSYNSGVIVDFLKYSNLLHLKKEEDKKNAKFLIRPLQIKHDKTFFKPGDTHILYDNINAEEECNLYLVSTPGQLLSAIEVQHHFKTKNNVLVILFFVVGDDKNINHMFKLSQYFPFDRLITYQNKSAKYYISFIPFLKFLKKYDYNYVFFGFNTILYRRTVANVNYKNLFYLDDGVHTITTHDIVHGKRKASPEYKPFNMNLNLLKMLYVYGKHGLKVDDRLKKLSYFTVYNLEPYGNETIIKHSYSHVRKLFDISDIKDKNIYLLGQPLTNIGIEQDIYDGYVEYIFTKYKDYNIVYCPHRLEKISSCIKSKIEKFDNIELLDPGMPIELYFLENGIYPYKVVSFITSALFNINKMYPKTITVAFKIDTSNLEEHHVQGIYRIYENYKKENIRIKSIK